MHIMSKHFKESVKERPKDFMSKFLTGSDWFVEYISFRNVNTQRVHPEIWYSFKCISKILGVKQKWTNVRKRKSLLSWRSIHHVGRHTTSRWGYHIGRSGRHHMRRHGHAWSGWSSHHMGRHWHSRWTHSWHSWRGHSRSHTHGRRDSYSTTRHSSG